MMKESGGNDNNDGLLSCLLSIVYAPYASTVLRDLHVLSLLNFYTHFINREPRQRSQ